MHLIVQYDERCVEVQLRTRIMHEWAVAVERRGGRIGSDLKSGRGPTPVLHLLEAIAEAMALEEQGKTVGDQLEEKMHRLREEAEPFLTGGRS